MRRPGTDRARFHRPPPPPGPGGRRPPPVPPGGPPQEGDGGAGGAGSGGAGGPQPLAGRRRRGTPWRELLIQGALLVGIFGSLVGLVLLITDTTPNQLGALVVLMLGPPLTLVVARAMAHPQDRAFVLKLVAAGVLLRVGLALFIHTRLPVGFFAPDQFTYQDVGWRTLQYLRGLGSRPAQISDTFEVGYFYWNAALYAVFGFAPLAAKLVNCFVGAWTGLVAYRIGGELAGQGGARNAALLVTLFPSLVLWSTQNMRDPATVFFLALILWIVLRLRVRASFSLLVALTVLMGVMAVLRDYMAVMLVFALVGSFVISPGRRLVVNLVLGTVLLGVAIAAYQQLGLGDEWIASASFETIDETRRNMAIGQTAFAADVDISDPLRGIQFLPLGLAFFLLSPFPWQIGSLLSIMTLPEQMVWYCLVPFVVYGGWFLVRERFNRIEPILIFTIVTTAIYALVEGNAGTAYRHRAQVVVFMLIFAAVGLEVWRLRRRSRRRTPA